MIDGPVGNIICLVLGLALVLLLIRVVLSWLPMFGARPPATGPLRTAHDLIFDVTEPMLRPLRAIVPPAGVVDLSVMVAFVIIFVFQTAFC